MSIQPLLSFLKSALSPGPFARCYINRRPTQTDTDLLSGRPAVAKAMARQARPDKNRTSLRDKNILALKLLRS
jgi:hypothetical protein